MTTRQASCSCGQLRAICEGEPVRVSMCHCLACQKRTGSIFGVQARFPRDNVATHGRATTFRRKADSGNTVTFHFCPDCGATVYWQIDAQPDLTAVAVGAFADPNFPSPRFSVFESCRHGWAMSPSELEMEHH
jgi:hypothetical protein